jgi:hypothetical protein
MDARASKKPITSSAFATPDDYGKTGNHTHWPLIWLGLLWVAAFLSRIAAGSVLRGPYIFPDEFDYWEMARSFVATGHFQLYQLPTPLPTILYPLSISPAFFWHAPLQQYLAVRVISAILITAVVLPTYGFAREVVSERLALAAALLVFLNPSGIYAGTVMAENLFFPVSILSLWMAYRTLLRGRWIDALVAGALFSVGFFVKIQQMFLVVAYAVPVIVWIITELISSKPHNERKTVLHGAFVRTLPGLMFLAMIAFRWTIGRASHQSFAASVFGESYASITGFQGHLDKAWFLASALGLFEVLCISTLFAPMASLFCSLTIWRDLPRNTKLLWWLVMASVGVYILLVARHNALHDNSWRVHERYVFVVSPLLWIFFFAVYKNLRLRTLFAVALVIGAVCSMSIGRMIQAGAINWASPMDSATLTSLWYLYFRHSPIQPVGFILILIAVSLLGAYLLRRGAIRTAVATFVVTLVLMNSAWYILQRKYIYKRRSEEVRSELELRQIVSGSGPVAMLYNVEEHPEYLPAMFDTFFWLENPVTVYGKRDEFSPSTAQASKIDFSKVPERYVVCFGNDQPELPLFRRWTNPAMSLYRNEPSNAPQRR